MLKKLSSLLLIFTLILCIGCASTTNAHEKEPVVIVDTPNNYNSIGTRDRVLVSENGALQVVNNQLSNAKGEPVWLRGMSTHGLQWYPNNLNEESAKILADEWRADIVRLSMYINEGSGAYRRNEEKYKTQILPEKIKYLMDNDMYIIIDWHMLNPGDPNHLNYAGADDFFEYMLTNYGHYDNFIWEICNEPSGTPWTEIKSYADRIIGVIRNINPNALVIVGTPAWASLGLSGEGGYKDIIDNPIIDPTPGKNNIMYSFHFYAAGHDYSYYGGGLRDFASYLPVFVTEFGTQWWDGDQANDFDASDLYLDMLDELKISWVNWNFSNDRRTGAVLKKAGDYYDLKESGLYVRNRIQMEPKF